MAGRYKPVPLEPAKYSLAGGVDTKTHGYVLPAPKLQVCENAYIEQTGSLRRRFGRSALANGVQGGTVAAGWTALATYDGDLLGFTASPGKAYQYSPGAATATGDGWIDKGSVESPRARSENVAKSGADAGALAGDSASARDITVHAYEEIERSGANVTTSVRITVVDEDGVVLQRAHTLYSVTAAAAVNNLGIKCVARGDLIYVFYYDGTATDIMVAIVNALTHADLTPTPVSVTTDVDTTVPCFDVAPNTTHGVFIAWNDATLNRISYSFVNTSGALVGAATATQATAADPTCIAVAVSTGLTVHGIAYCVGTTPADVYAMHRSWSGSAWSGLVGPSGTLDGSLAGPAVSVTCAYISATDLRVFYTEGVSASYPVIRQASYTTGAVATSRVTGLLHSLLASKVFRNSVDSRLYFWAHEGTTNATTAPTRFLMRDDGFLVTSAVEGNAGYPLRSNYALPQIQTVGATHWVSSAYTVGILSSTEFQSNWAIRRVGVDFVHDDSHAWVESHEALYLAGGFLQEFDGDSFREAWFLRPLNTILVSSVKSNTASGALTASGVYSYQLIYEDVNLRGKRLRSTNLGAHTLTALGAGDDTITLTIPTLAHTRRPGVVVGIYRRVANAGVGAPYYRVGEVANDTTVDSVTFVDVLSDTLAATREQYIGNTGEVDDSSLPACHVITIGGGRVLLAGFADAPNRVAVSKQWVDGRALEFSDFLPVMQLPEAGGPITALAVMNETTVAFKVDHIYRVRGDGPNNLGLGDFFPPEQVSADTGTSIARSVVVTPMGVAFEGQKGKMLLQPSLALAYFGAPLEKLTAPGTCKGVTLIPNLQQVRWSYAATTHVYDYYHQQWYVFTHASAGPTVLWNDVLTAIAGDLVKFDEPTLYHDDGTSYTMKLVLGWVSTQASLHGDLRVRALAIRGERLSSVNLSVIVRYDGETAVAQTIEETASGAGLLEYQWRLSRNICSMIEVTIQDSTAGGGVVAEAGPRLQELSFEVGLRTTSLGRKG